MFTGVLIAKNRHRHIIISWQELDVSRRPMSYSKMWLHTEKKHLNSTSMSVVLDFEGFNFRIFENPHPVLQKIRIPIAVERVEGKACMCESAL